MLVLKCSLLFLSVGLVLFLVPRAKILEDGLAHDSLNILFRLRRYKRTAALNKLLSLSMQPLQKSGMPLVVVYPGPAKLRA